MKEELSEDELLEQVTTSEYKYGFTTNIESDKIQKGLNEDTVRLISSKKNEPFFHYHHFVLSSSFDFM